MEKIILKDNSKMKKYNHYVWKHYLKPWANKKGIIIYKKEGRIREGNIICEQYFRTNDMKKRVTKFHKPIKNVNFENCWNIASHILAINLAGALSINKSRFTCILLENNTEIPFFTSDQPVVNIATNKNDRRILTNNEFEFYYPITPNIAILICLKENIINFNNNIFILNEIQVKNYNAIITSQGGSIIFSNTKKGLL